MVRLARVLGMVAGGMMGIPLVACDCDSGFPERFLDDFERACGEAVCDWAIEAGSARRVTTFHAAEHGLELGVGARLILTPAPFELGAGGVSPPSDQVQVLIDCESGSGLLVQAEVETADGVVVLEARIGSALAHAGDGRLRLARVPLAAAGVEARLEGEVQALRVIVEGDGACVIDDLRLVGGQMFSCM